MKPLFVQPPHVYNCRDAFDFFSLRPAVVGSAPVIPPPGWVEEGGSLAGNDISNSSESS